VTYFDNGGGDGLRLTWSGPDLKKQKIAPEFLSVGGASETVQDLAVRTLATLPGFESEKFLDWTRLIKADRQRAAAVTAMKTLPSTAWDAKELPSLVDNLVGYLSSIPAKNRTSGTAVETVELIKAFAEKLPSEQAKRIADRLQNLDVRTIAIGTVVERMNYDKERIAVAAGKPVEFRFSNTDNMPHNLVFIVPGSLEERNFVPVSDKVLLASKLLSPGESQTMTMDVPKQPGMYPFVCTYPGHWRRMFGVLVVVSDLEAYQVDPDAYLAANPLPMQDELLASIGRNTAWKFEDLVADVQQGVHGRSFEVGKSLFRAANCVGCHKLGGEGKEFGPDLSKLDEKKRAPEYLLKSILEPSAEIEEKYRSRIFQMSSEAIISGMVVEETKDQIKIMVDPLAKGEPTILEKADIEAEKKSEVSTMPQGLLSKLTREEILDLMAYVIAGGNKDHEAFAAHDHGHGASDHGHDHE
jgi:putative heme-binding domain-containing protein